MSSVLILLALLTVLCTAFYVYVKNAFSYWKKRGVPFLEPSLPFGNAGKLFMQKLSFPEVFEEHYNSSNAPVVGTFTFLNPALIVRDPKIVQDVLIKEFSSFYNRGMCGNEDIDPLANNLLLQSGEKWKKMRTKLSPAFTTSKLRGMFETIVVCGRPFYKYLDRFAVNSETIEIREIFARFTTNVIASVGFGIEIDCIENPDCEFRTYGRRYFEPSMKNVFRIILANTNPALVKFFRLRFADHDIGEFMIETIRQNVEHREKNNIVRKDFLQCMMQLRNTGNIKEDDDWSTNATKSDKSLSLEEMAAHAFLFFAAGFETASTTMSFCAYELAKDQNAQEKAYKEIMDVLNDHEGQLTYDSVGKMKYVGQCIDEVLRLHTPLGATSRRCTKDFRLPDSNQIIEAGIQVMIPITALHFDQKYYDQPKKFMPERFDEKLVANKSFVDMPYLPFGDGPRNCIGYRLGKLQTKVAIVLLLKKYRLELGAQHINRELKIDPKGVIKTPIDGINIKISFR